jgi:hypothetical protein
MNIMAIDPGNTQSAYVIIGSGDCEILDFGKIDNEILLDALWGLVHKYEIEKTVIEMVACYGMAVGKEVFDTCVWIGRFYEHMANVSLMYRKDVKMNICNTMKAKDANIIQALKDRFGDKGTKKEPGWFFGFSADVWQAYALAVTFVDKKGKTDV